MTTTMMTTMMMTTMTTKTTTNDDDGGNDYVFLVSDAIGVVIQKVDDRRQTCYFSYV